MPKILIIDDSVAVRNFFSKIVSKNGFTIECAANGKEGLAKAISSQPNVIILDISLPEMDGMEVYSRLRNNPATENIPVIFYSPICPQLNRIILDMLKAPVKYIRKPCDLEFILKQIHWAMGS